MSIKKLAGAALAGALAVTAFAFAPSPAEASPGACVAHFGPSTDVCSFTQTGSSTLNYNIVLEGNREWEVGMCIAATFECVRKFAGSEPAGTVTNPACLTQECYGYVNLHAGWIDSLGYIYTV
ncbi:MAG TPA: hypothetical protein VNB24_04500 [Acidimicrobiales bacterium]|nr:hypothetical protein [Acidimicrobiales bacterium]